MALGYLENLLVERFGAEAIMLTDMPERLHEFDIIVTCTASTLPILGKGLLVPLGGIAALMAMLGMLLLLPIFLASLAQDLGGQSAHWKANHADQVARCALLRAVRWRECHVSVVRLCRPARGPGKMVGDRRAGAFARGVFQAAFVPGGPVACNPVFQLFADGRTEAIFQLQQHSLAACSQNGPLSSCDGVESRTCPR